MKNFKKLASLLLVLVMVFSLSVVAFAANSGSITINNATAGQDYKAFKLFDATISADGKNITYTGTIPGELSEYFELKDTGIVATDAAKSGEGLSAEAVTALKAWAAKQNKPAGTVTAAGDSATISNLPYGYYVVTTTLGSAISVDSTNPNATVTDKQEKPDIDKVVKEDSTGAWGPSNSAQIGQKVEYKTTVHAKPGATKYVVHDTMEKGLTFNKDITVEGLTLNKDYTVVTTNLKDGCTFEIRFTEAYLNSLTENTDIVITYSATLNGEAEISTNSNDNTTWLTYSNKEGTETAHKTTETYTFTFDIVKTDSEGKLLSGATFRLYTQKEGGNAVELVSTANYNEYRIVAPGDNDLTSDLISVTNGKVKIVGVDADAATSYWLEEVNAPAGYNLLKERVEVSMKGGKNLDATITADKYTDGGVQIINKTGTELPSTGGIGTTIFYVVGAVLVLGAGITLVVKRRSEVQ